MHKKRSGQLYLFFLISCLLIACHTCTQTADTSHIRLKVKIERFDHDFQDLQTDGSMAQKVMGLHKKYGSFYQDFVAGILQLDTNKDTVYFNLIRNILKSKPYIALQQAVDSVYPNLKVQEAELTDAFKRIQYYFPQKKLPKVYAYVSGFQVQSSIGNDYVAIGLDLFLGSNAKFYQGISHIFPRYIARRFTPANITPRVVEAVVRGDMFVEKDDYQSLLDKMIYNGKILYFMDKILPEVPDTTKIGYTTQQLAWCNKFRSQIWAFFLEEKLLYETDYQKIQRYLHEAPFTPGLGEHNESAPKLAVWTGWQIVRQYMEKNPAVTLPQLMDEPDLRKILNKSKYRPK